MIDSEERTFYMKHRNKIITTSLFAAALLAASLSACSGSKTGEVLNLYTWEGMFPDEILKGFEDETGIKINYVNFDYNETMLSKLEASGGGEYDLILADDYIIEAAIAEGLVQPIDQSKLSNAGNINPLYRGQYYDPDDTYTIPYGAGVQTIVYRPDAVQTEIKGYADLWDASLLDRVGIIGNFRVINGMALKVLGYSYNTEDETEIRAAGDLLYQIAPNIRLIKDDYIQDDLISGEIDAAVMYTSQVTAAVQADPSLAVVYPEEGIGFGIMAMFIPQHAPNADAAHKFIDYILDAENGAGCFAYLGYFCTSSASEAYLSDDMRTALTLPADIQSAQMEMIKTISNESSDLHMEIWTTFRGLCE